MKIAYIHNDKKVGTGAHYINDLISQRLRQEGVFVKNFYPKTALMDSPDHLKGLASILFFYGLLEHKGEVSRFTIIQGTTYTPLPFLALNVPVVTHFGSTTSGFLKSTPRASLLEKSTRGIWYELRKARAISELNVRTRKPMRDIAAIELYAAQRATAVIATSENVKNELIEMGVDVKKIAVIHNAIEDYWFENSDADRVRNQHARIVFLGRLGKDAFTLKLKGLDRLIHLYRSFPMIKKTTVCMTGNKSLKDWLKTNIRNHETFVNMKKDVIPHVLRPLRGSVLFLPSRYEGFSLSLIEGMSQGLVPVSYPVGVAEEVIEDGKNGFVVRSQREAISRVRELLHSPSLREQMSQGAQLSSQAFQSHLMAKKLLQLYNTILTNKTSSMN